MKIPLYILGVLQRYGPQHGYEIKKIINDKVSDFTQIKLPSIYYHLEKLRENSLLLARLEKNSNRPERTVYSITEKGKAEFQRILKNLLSFEYRPEFIYDAIFYFSGALNSEKIRDSLKVHIREMKLQLERINQHKDSSVEFLPKISRKAALVIFSHHEYHLQAELDWAIETLESIKSD